MRPAIELGEPLAYGGQIVPPPRRVQPTAGYEVGWSLWGRLLSDLTDVVQGRGSEVTPAGGRRPRTEPSV